MDFGAFFQSLNGQFASGGLSEKPNPSNRWPATATVSENPQQGSFDQTVRQLFKTMGSDRPADQKRTDPEEPGSDDPNMMLLIEMIKSQSQSGHGADIHAGAMLSAQTDLPGEMTSTDGQHVAGESSLAEMMATFGDAAPSDPVQVFAMISAVTGGAPEDNQPKDPMAAFVTLLMNDGRNIDAHTTIVGKTTVSTNETTGSAGFTVDGQGSDPEALSSGAEKLMNAFQDGAEKAAFTTLPGVNWISTRPTADAKTANHMAEEMRDAALSMEPEGDDSAVSGDHRAAATSASKISTANQYLDPTKTTGLAVTGQDEMVLNQRRPSGKTDGPGVAAAEPASANALEEEILKSESHAGGELRSNPPARMEDHPSAKKDAPRLFEEPSARSVAPENLKSDTLPFETAKTAVQGNPAVEKNQPVPTSASSHAQEAGEDGFRREIMDQIVERAVVRSTTDRSEIRIQLKPEALGDVRMSIVSEKNQLAVRMITDKPAVKEIIESHIHQLRAELDKHGLTVEKIEVLVNTGEQHQQNREQFFQMSKNGSFGGGRRQPGGRHQEPPAQPQSTDGTGSDPSPDGISYFA